MHEMVEATAGFGFANAVLIVESGTILAGWGVSVRGDVASDIFGETLSKLIACFLSEARSKRPYFLAQSGVSAKGATVIGSALFPVALKFTF